MLKLFTLDYYIRSSSALRPECLLEHGICLFVCDIDNMLVPRDVALPDEKAVQFIRDMQEAGIWVVLIGSNAEERVETFVKGLQTNYYPFAMKPLPKTCRRMLKEQGVDKKEVAVVGGQLVTDIPRANLMGLYMVLTVLVVTKDLSSTKSNRFFENIVLRLLQITGRFRKGEYDE